MTDLENQMDALSLFLVKPDALAQKEDVYARDRIKQEGLIVVREQEVKFTPEIAWNFYFDKRDKKFTVLLRYITAGESVAMIVSGPECYKKLHALKQEMRAKFNHGDINTGTHSSDDVEGARRELLLLGIPYWTKRVM